ncbi:hypothetical protein BDFB_013821 [Asbolus verrucosus]|uniref:Uncharacterized protein n=1 Tax=Asbolus verrucosus TaxID=1661398 RepID=A0A482W7K5_ASBVE|nr:hypothetical protein BDFB_013821 [Asbolus verrucosus]
MSPKNQVHPLSCLCIKLVSTQLIQALSDDEGRNYEVVERYLFDATYEVVQELLKNILNSVNLDAATRFSCLQVLLRQDVKKLDTGIFPHSYYKAILKVITQKGTGLRQLNLKGVWVRDHPNQLSELVRSLRKLKILIIPHMADDEVLEATTKCSSLSVLDISGECCFTTTGLRQLKSEMITVLDIGSFGKRDVCQQNASDCDIIAEIIESLPNLTSLRTYSFTGSSLFTLYKKNSKHKTRLKYLHDTGTTNDIMEAIANMCENLESIHLDTPDKGVISRLTQLKKLCCVKLTHHDSQELLDYLRMSGSRLQVLKLNHDKSCSLNLCDICLTVPNLQTLECFQLKLAFYQLNTFFMNLENIEILYCDVTDTSLKNILMNSPFLKRIIIGCVINMTDGDIFRLCAECDFLCLEELWFSCARGLTSTSVELLMGHCPNLKVIGQLNGWDIHQEEIDYLRSVILYTNTDLTLLPLGTFS